MRIKHKYHVKSSLSLCIQAVSPDHLSINLSMRGSRNNIAKCLIPGITYFPVASTIFVPSGGDIFSRTSLENRIK